MSSYWQPTEYFGLEEKRQNELMHYGILGMKWGIRRFQNKDGSLTDLGRQRYLNLDDKVDYNVNRGIGSNRQKEAVAKVGKIYQSRLDKILPKERQAARDAQKKIDDLYDKWSKVPYDPDDPDGDTVAYAVNEWGDRTNKEAYDEFDKAWDEWDDARTKLGEAYLKSDAASKLVSMYYNDLNLAACIDTAYVGKRYSQKMYNTIISDKYERALDRKLNKKLGRYPYGTDDRDNNGLISDKYAAKAREELRSKSEEQLRDEKLKNTKTQEDKYDLEASDRKGDNLEEAQYHFLKERYENNPNRKQDLPLDSKEVQYKYQYRMAKEAYKFIHSKYARRDVDYVIEDYPVEKEIKSTGEKYIANYYNLKLTDVGVQNLEKIARANPNDRAWVESFNKDVELSRKTAKIRQMANNGLTYSEIADRLGVSKSTIADVLN